MTLPISVTSDGNVKVVYVAALANPAAPTLAELTAPTVLDLTMYLTGDGWRPNTDEQSVTDDRLGSRQNFEDRGRFMETLEIAYVYNPASPANDKARTTLTVGTTGFLVPRWGVDIDTPFAAGDIVDVYTVRFGRQRKQPGEANTKLRIVQKPFVYGKHYQDVAVAA
jgi:hypothetical protein